MTNWVEVYYAKKKGEQRQEGATIKGVAGGCS